MSPEKTKQLVDNYPIIFAKIKHLECDDGWFFLINNLCKVIECHITSQLTKSAQDQTYAVQIKEKFGGLRCYFNRGDNYIGGAIRLAEIMSNSICENCGSFGEHRNINGWIITLCDEHFQKELNKKS